MNPVGLGAVTLSSEILSRVLTSAWDGVEPHFVELLRDPSGVVSRVGDTLIWKGESGQQVIGGLEMLTESHTRIETAVSGIESAQLAMEGTLGVVQQVSLATLGLTSLSGALMLWRFEALTKRIDGLRERIVDIDNKIDALHKAHLRNSLLALRDFDEMPKSKGKLERALEEARTATNIYGEIATDEARKKNNARLNVLNCRGRLYLISVLTELRCLISSDQSTQALNRISDVSDNLRLIAQTCFDQTLKVDPERFLRVAFQNDGVDLNLI
ncbi:MAG: hypothetical protein KDD60_13020, partial [Bdellovibrionales bacterium]|nr:hypothetical protein [Bdellovibrionales bacterium]